MAWKSSVLHLTSFIITIWPYWPQSYAQTISTDTPVPPLQWLNISGLLKGSSSPPPLKDAAIGYDETSRSLIIFGGESAKGFVQSQTYLLNLDTLTWSVPSPPANLQRTPPARSASVAGGDFAGSNRQGFVVIGGKDSNGQGLSDIWEYDFNNKFWSEVNTPSSGPLPRWGASGGIDVLTPPTPDPVVPGPNNTFFLVGGSDGTNSRPLSDVWRLSIAGTLSSNLPDSSTGSWDRLTIGNLPAKLNQAGTVLSNRVIIAGGCNANSSSGFCAEQDAYVIDTSRLSDISPGACPAPRLSPVLVPNANKFSTTFASQVYLLLGTIDVTRWEDDNGLKNGEVAVLDINTGSWSRILPSGDPGISGKSSWPTPREGAAAFSHNKGLVGQSRDAFSDTIVFGGRDSSGNILSEVWLLRAYAGIITPSTSQWSGFGNGELQTGVDANGAGVRIKYMTKCASAIHSSSSKPTTTSTIPTPTPTLAPGILLPTFYPFDTSELHKILAPLSIALLQPGLFLFCAASPSYYKDHLPVRWALYGTIFVAYALGFAGLVTSFTGISSALTGNGSSTNLHLKTGHGIAGLVFFICMYGLLPGLLVVFSLAKRMRHSTEDLMSDGGKPEHTVSPVSMEKIHPNSEPARSASQSLHGISPPTSPRPRTNSWGPSSVFRRSPEGRLSSDSDSSSIGPSRGFEVVNRPTRARRASGGWLTHSAENSSPQPIARSLGDIDWLQRRRSLNAVGELDYAISQAHRTQLSSTPATTDALMSSTLQMSVHHGLPTPRPSEIALRLIIQTLLLGLFILTLVILWQRAPRFAFALFLAWSITFYAAIFIFSWHLRPENSFLSALFNRVRYEAPNVSNSSSAPTPIPEPLVGPYIHHQPPHRTTAIPDDASVALRSVETNVYDDDVDEHTTQRMIEEEMGRRDVSIVTVPKRKLWITNPS